jgi:hypothetical protein
VQAQLDGMAADNAQEQDAQPHWLFGTLAHDETEHSLLHQTKEEHMPNDSGTPHLAGMAKNTGIHPVAMVKRTQHLPELPSAANDRIKLLQMSATRRGIAAGMRM